MDETVRLRKQLLRTRISVFILLVVCVMFLIFAYVQKLEADAQQTLAHQLERRAVEQEKIAAEQLVISQATRVHAEQQMLIVAEQAKALEDCRKRK